MSNVLLPTDLIADSGKPMFLMPREHWRIKFVPEPPCVLVSAHVTIWPDHTAREWLKFRLDEIPNEYVSLDDLERMRCSER